MPQQQAISQVTICKLSITLKNIHEHTDREKTDAMILNSTFIKRNFIIRIYFIVVKIKKYLE